jgi:hypothetical protein
VLTASLPLHPGSMHHSDVGSAQDSWQILHCSSDDCGVVACKLAGSIRSRYSCCEGSCCAMQFVLLFCGVDGPATAAGTILGGVAMNRSG